MPRVAFTANLRRHREAPVAEAEGATVREVLDRVFGEDPLLRSYILDEQGRLRRHVNVFVGGRMVADRRALERRGGAGGRDLRAAGAFGRVSDGGRTACGDPQGALRLPHGAGRLDGRAAGVPRRAGVGGARATRATARSMPRSTSGISAASCTARTTAGRAGRSCPAPAYPAEEAADAPALEMIWTLAAGGRTRRGRSGPGRCRAGSSSAATAGRAGRWWRRSGRGRSARSGSAAATIIPGIHSILVDPRDADRLTVGVSCGGVWKSDDRGASWRLAGKGLRAAYMPPERAYDAHIQDPHLIAACAADAGGGLVPAPQRHVPLDRRRRRPSSRSSRRRPRASASPWRRTRPTR